mgnify:CR=1 FL=1
MATELTRQTGSYLTSSAENTIQDLLSKGFLAFLRTTPETAIEILKGSQNAVRHMKPEQEKELRAVIITCASSYCGMDVKSTSITTWDACVKMVKEDFKNIGVNEIEVAFRLCASGKLNVNMTAYYGKFTVAILGEILRAYVNDLRNYNLSEIRKAIEAKEKHEKEEADKAKNSEVENQWKEEFDKPETWQQIKRWQDIPHYKVRFWYSLIPKLSSDEKKNVFFSVLKERRENLKEVMNDARLSGNERELQSAQEQAKKLNTASEHEQMILLADNCMKFIIFQNREIKFFDHGQDTNS